jgi:hypothetical protein
LVRNMHDAGCGDVPIIYIGWTSDLLEKSLDCWVWLGEGNRSDLDKKERYEKLEALSTTDQGEGKSVACFHQVDLVVRGLFGDPNADYCPPFIVLLPDLRTSDESKQKGHILYRHPAFRPANSLLSDWPTDCGAPDCPDPECSLLDLRSSYALPVDSPLVQERLRSPTLGERLCNNWGCPK